MLCPGLLSNQFLIIGPFTTFLLVALMNSTSMSRQVKTSFAIFENVILEVISRKWIGLGAICIFVCDLSISCPIFFYRFDWFFSISINPIPLLQRYLFPFLIETSPLSYTKFPYAFETVLWCSSQLICASIPSSVPHWRL